MEHYGVSQSQQCHRRSRNPTQNMMTSSTKQKAIRAIIGALISGSFSETEIEEISRVFVDSSDFGTDLGALLKGVSESLRASKKFDKKALKPKQSRSAP